jgi:O-antigen/teichoic acid export membrane protein
MKTKILNNKYLFFSILSLLEKIVPYLLFPLVLTLINNSSDFGYYSLYLNLVNILLPFVLLGIIDTSLSHFYKKTYSVQQLYSTSIFIVCFIALLLLSLTLISGDFFISRSGIYFSTTLIIINVLFSSLKLVSENILKLLNIKKSIIKYSLLNIFFYHLIIVFLLIIEVKDFIFLTSFLLSTFLTLILELKELNRYINFHKISIKLIKEVLVSSVIIIPLHLLFFVFNYLDQNKVVSEFGLSFFSEFSIISKFSSISQIVTLSLSVAFPLFSYSRNVNDNVLVSKFFIFFSTLSIIFYSSLIFISEWLAFFFPLRILIDFASSIPILFIFPLLVFIYNIQVNQLIKANKIYRSLISILLGFFVNIALKDTLYSNFGINGIFISSTVGIIIIIISSQLLFRESLILDLKSSLILLVTMSINILVTLNILNKVYIAIVIIVLLLFLIKQILNLLKK